MVWARHILTPDEAGALSARGQIVAGSIPFEDMAMMLSTDTASAEKGGDLGWFGRGMMVKEFEEAAFSLEIGEISEPVKSDFGYHIIQVLGKDVRPITESQLSSKKNAVFASWLEEERAAIEGSLIINEELRSQFAPAEPSFNDPKIYEVFFGINPYDAQRTQSAKATQEAETFSVNGTKVPTDEIE
ncbi:MAG: peptidylprolyl isomerase [Anaerolineaceae bacterium]|nr:peptidylprolyl isomerase [Anaerolineaceae bacterium]